MIQGDLVQYQRKTTIGALISYYNSFFLRVYTRMQRECKVRIKLAQKIENAVTQITSSAEWEGGE